MWQGRTVHEESAPRGHQLAEHTADMALMAWAPTRTECLGEAVRALAGSFIDLNTASPTESFAVTFAAAGDEDLLVRLLEEVIYLLDVFNRVPLDAEVEDRDGGLIVHFATARPEEVELVGAVPKAVSLHELAFGQRRGGWHCTVTVDV